MKTRTLLLALSMLAVITCSSFTPPNNEKVLGTWWTPEQEAKVKIYKAVSGKICGKIIWLKEPTNPNGTPKLDLNNPDKEAQKQALLQMVFLKNFVYNGDNKWEDGTIYDANNGKTYSAHLELLGDDQLNIRGYVGFSLLGRTAVFRRVR